MNNQIINNSLKVKIKQICFTIQICFVHTDFIVRES